VAPFSDLTVKSGRDFSRISIEFCSVVGAGLSPKVLPKGKSGTLPLTLAAGVLLTLLLPYASKMPHFPRDCV